MYGVTRAQDVLHIPYSLSTHQCNASSNTNEYAPESVRDFTLNYKLSGQVWRARVAANVINPVFAWGLKTCGGAWSLSPISTTLLSASIPI